MRIAFHNPKKNGCQMIESMLKCLNYFVKCNYNIANKANWLLLEKIGGDDAN